MKPKVLLVRPIAGHTSKIMDRTIKSLSKYFTVHMPELDHNTYSEYLRSLRDQIKQHKNIIGVCQGGTGVVHALQGLSHVGPKNIVLIAAPLDPYAAPSIVSKLTN